LGVALLVVRVFGLLAAAVVAASAAAGAASAYVEALAAGLAGWVEEPVEARGGLPMVTVYSGASILPYTSLVGRGLLEEARGLEGVVHAWPETLSLALAGGEVVVVRGVPVDAALAGVEPPGDPGVAVVGRRLADRLGVADGDVVVLYSPLAGGALPFTARTTDMPEPFNHEVIVSFEAGLALRGDKSPSLVRIVYDPNATSPEEILSGLGASPGGLLAVAQRGALLVLRGELRAPAAGAAYAYLERLGLPPAALVAAALAADAALAASMYPLGAAMAHAKADRLRVLVIEGAGPRRLRVFAAGYAALLALAGAALSLALAWALPSPWLLGRPLEPGIDPVLALAHLTLYPALAAAGAWNALD